MRVAAISSASNAAFGHCVTASSISACVSRSFAGESFTWSKRSVNAITASSPLPRTPAIILRTEATTSSSSPRLAEISVSKARSKSGARESRRRAMSALCLMFGPATGRPFAAQVRKPGLDAFDVQPDRAAAREKELDHAARILRAFRREANCKQRDHGIVVAAHHVLGPYRQHAVEMQPGAHSEIVAPALALLGGFPLEAVEQRRETPRLGQPHQIAYARHRVLQARGDDFEVFGIRCRQSQFRFRHADCRSMSAPTRESFSSSR